MNNSYPLSYPFYPQSIHNLSTFFDSGGHSYPFYPLFYFTYSIAKKEIHTCFQKTHAFLSRVCMLLKKVDRVDRVDRNHPPITDFAPKKSG